MKRWIANLTFVGILLGGAVLALGPSKPATAADDAVVQADRALVQALQKGDRAAAEKFLDKDFSWIDSNGVMWAPDDAFQAGIKPLISDASAAKITEHKYGKVVWIQENVDNKYAAHFWVQRPAGWRLLHTNEITIDSSKAFHEVRPNFAVPCINPCQQIPYTAADGKREGSPRRVAGSGGWHRASRCAPGRKSARGPFRKRRAASQGGTHGRNRQSDGRPGGSQPPAGWSRPGIVDALVGFRRRGCVHHAAANVWRQSLLVEPSFRQSQWILDDGGELPHHDPGCSAHDCAAQRCQRPKGQLTT